MGFRSTIASYFGFTTISTHGVIPQIVTKTLGVINDGILYTIRWLGRIGGSYTSTSIEVEVKKVKYKVGNRMQGCHR